MGLKGSLGNISLHYHELWNGMAPTFGVLNNAILIWAKSFRKLGIGRLYVQRVKPLDAKGHWATVGRVSTRWRHVRLSRGHNFFVD